MTHWAAGVRVDPAAMRGPRLYPPGATEESQGERRRAYAEERAAHADLDVPLDRPLASRLHRLLCGRFGVAVTLSLYEVDPPPEHRLAGRCLTGHDAFRTGRPERVADVELYHPWRVRVLGHEYAHAWRWVTRGLRGHGEGWLEDLAQVHAVLRKALRYLNRNTPPMTAEEAAP